MTSEDQACLNLGKMIVRMINDLTRVAGDDTGYARQRISYPGGEVFLCIARNEELVRIWEEAAERVYKVIDAIPPSQAN